eukprot:g33781.t1
MISESLVLLRDTIAYVQYRGMDTCFISLDQEKAIDRVLHTRYPLSVRTLMSICDQFELALGAKVNQGKSEAMFFGNWANDPLSASPDTMYKVLDEGGKNVPIVALILTYVNSCIKLWVDPQFANTKIPYIPRFYMSLVLRRMGLALLLNNTPSGWTVPHHLSFVEKFAKKNTFVHKFIRKWSAHSVLKTLWEKEGGFCRSKELTSNRVLQTGPFQ